MLRPDLPQAYDLMHRGNLALARAEANGIRVDTEYLSNALTSTQNRIKQNEEELRSTDEFKTWKRRFGSKAKIGSREQLASIVFEDLGYKATEYTDTGAYKTDKKALEMVTHPFVVKWVETQKLHKAHGTYLKGIEREIIDGFLHTVFNLHIARTYRSSSQLPNFQNFPIRDPLFGELIRRCFIPRGKRRVLVEIDYSGVEVRISACYNKDPMLIEYINDPTKDMHRDMAAQCYKCSPEQVSKQMRYCGKNMFVFPEFYGSYYIQCALPLWQAINMMKLNIDDVSLYKWLKKKGIEELGQIEDNGKPTPGSFAAHIKKVEEDFWGRRFKVYAKWKEEWYQQYRKTGSFATLTGFREFGHFKKNDTINHPVQGSAFHCLLWSLIHVLELIEKKGIDAYLIGQIHDSMLFDVAVDELDDFLPQVINIMTKRIRKAWPWIIVPLDAEIEVAPPGASWFDKKAYQLAC